jgi:hypothetical protein
MICCVYYIKNIQCSKRYIDGMLRIAVATEFEIQKTQIAEKFFCSLNEK